VGEVDDHEGLDRHDGLAPVQEHDAVGGFEDPDGVDVTQASDGLTVPDVVPRLGQAVTFGVDGPHCEIDLSAANAKELRAVLKAYTHKSRAVTPPRRQSRSWPGQTRMVTRSPNAGAFTVKSLRRTAAPTSRLRGEDPPPVLA
jgi:hypothetical protein